MPMVELKVSGYKLNDGFVKELETKITRVLQDTISTSFAIGLGYGTDHKHHDIAKKTVERIMPGWTMINVEECVWAWGGVRSDDVIVRIQTLVLANAVALEWRRAIATNLFNLMKKMFADAGDRLKIFNTVIEGEVTMSLPPELFADLLKDGEKEKELHVNDIVEVTKYCIQKNIDHGGVF